MHKKIASLALGLLAPIAAAQCPLDPAIGTLMPYGGFDYEYPIRRSASRSLCYTTYTNVNHHEGDVLPVDNGVPPSGASYSPTTAELASGSPRSARVDGHGRRLDGRRL
jgi:hypothetical protein